MTTAVAKRKPYGVRIMDLPEEGADIEVDCVLSKNSESAEMTWERGSLGRSGHCLRDAARTFLSYGFHPDLIIATFYTRAGKRSCSMWGPLGGVARLGQADEKEPD